jgi:hypothetical protein
MTRERAAEGREMAESLHVRLVVAQVCVSLQSNECRIVVRADMAGGGRGYGDAEKPRRAKHHIPTACFDPLSGFLQTLCSPFLTTSSQTHAHTHTHTRITLFNNRACLYQFLTLVRVDFLERSNINRSTSASLQTRGSMCRYSCWPVAYTEERTHTVQPSIG